MKMLNDAKKKVKKFYKEHEEKIKDYGYTAIGFVVIVGGGLGLGYVLGHNKGYDRGYKEGGNYAFRKGLKMMESKLYYDDDGKLKAGTFCRLDKLCKDDEGYLKADILRTLVTICEEEGSMINE